MIFFLVSEIFKFSYYTNLVTDERLFKIQGNGAFLFEISFFVLEILTFFYYAN